MKFLLDGEMHCEVELTLFVYLGRCWLQSLFQVPRVCCWTQWHTPHSGFLQCCAGTYSLHTPTYVCVM